MSPREDFGWRGRQEQYDTYVTDFDFQVTDDGTDYVIFHEDITKTSQSGLTDKSRPNPPQMFATNTDRCPVKTLKSYLARRPLSFGVLGWCPL